MVAHHLYWSNTALQQKDAKPPASSLPNPTKVFAELSTFSVALIGGTLDIVKSGAATKAGEKQQQLDQLT